jgi:hypothetical protein
MIISRQADREQGDLIGELCKFSSRLCQKCEVNVNKSSYVTRSHVNNDAEFFGEMAVG